MPATTRRRSLGYVLIVEADTRKRDILRLAASAANHAVEVAATWALASQRVASGKIDLIACTEGPPDTFVVPERVGIVRLSLSSVPSSVERLALAFQTDPLAAYRKMAALSFSPELTSSDEVAAPVLATTTRT